AITHSLRDDSNPSRPCVPFSDTFRLPFIVWLTSDGNFSKTPTSLLTDESNVLNDCTTADTLCPNEVTEPVSWWVLVPKLSNAAFACGSNPIIPAAPGPLATPPPAR